MDVITLIICIILSIIFGSSKYKLSIYDKAINSGILTCQNMPQTYKRGDYYVSSSPQRRSYSAEKKKSKERTLRDFFERLKRNLTKKFGKFRLRFSTFYA